MPTSVKPSRLPVELTPSTSVGIEPPLADTYVRQSRGYCSRCLRDAGWLGYGVPRPDLPCPGCGDYTLTYEEFVAPCRHCGLGLEAHDDHTCSKFERRSVSLLVPSGNVCWVMVIYDCECESP